MKNVEIKDLQNNPLLRKLLVDYCVMTYEENSILDDYHLFMEYNLLLSENRLNDLFISEMFTNEFKSEA